MTPSKVRREGARAFSSGVELEDNPYRKPGVPAYMAGRALHWQEGWQQQEKLEEQWNREDCEADE